MRPFILDVFYTQARVYRFAAHCVADVRGSNELVHLTRYKYVFIAYYNRVARFSIGLNTFLFFSIIH